MFPIARLLLCSVALVGTSACQLFSGSNAAVSASARPSDDYFTQQMEAGRTHLAAGRTTLAIDSFRIAARDPQLTAKALNGLAISYDQLQRPDLARRYFTSALAAAPDDEQITRNMARFEVRQAALALQHSQRNAAMASAREFLDKHPLDQVAAGAAVPAAQVAPAQTIRRRQEVQLVSSSAGVRLQSGTDQNTQSTGVMVAQRAPASQYPVRVEIARGTAQPTTADYPIRIALNSPER